MKLHETATGALIATTLAFAAACGNTSQQQTTVRSSPTASPASSAPTDVSQRVSDEAGKVADKAKDAGEKIKEGAKDAAAELGVQKQVLDVKAALMADTSIDASKIDVDGDAASKTVTLKGTVPTATHKSAAEKVARTKAEGYTVRNQLTVAAK